MDKKILLIEPGFKTKYPPLGLMKISTYHKILGDKVYFFKGMNLPYELACEYWDRIYISTVFTYNWKITIDTINYYKGLVDDINRLKVGGILATLMPKELWEATGIIPTTGLLNTIGIFDSDNNLIIDNMIPDYNLFNDSGVEYSLVNNSYIGYTTRGCKNECNFCGVPTLEPKYIDYINIKDYVNGIKINFGEKQHLVLMDNNVLASKNFKNIINDIIDLGFGKNSKFNNKQRHVDFNQGVDARKINENNIKLLSKISIHPLRIAFDSLKLEKIYTRSVELAAKNEIRNLSNYILYNYFDTPEDLWKRLKINIDLNKKYNLQIYSFPMKYIPLYGKDSQDRKFICEPYWNWQYIRGVQRIINVLKGAVMPREDFFYRAFGENEKDFIRILYMPENILMNRSRKIKSEEKEWNSKYTKLTENEKRELLQILCDCQTKASLLLVQTKTMNSKIKNILEYYLPNNVNKNELDLPFEN